jgi:exodeoxyribonuclease V alpha subunit
MWPHPDELDGLSDHQREQYQLATRGVIAILSGSPGCGKTFVAAAVIKAIMRLYPQALVKAAGPTGKSAVRLTESLEKCGVSLTATTVHSLLGVKSNDDDGFGFQHNSTNPLELKFLLIDEFSMCDVPLVASLLEARPMGGHYLILGDPNQLAPVGHGAPLRDMLRCPDSIPSGTLSEIRRNSGRGVQVCAAIRDKKPWTCSPKLDIENGENLLLVDAANPAAQIEALERLIRSFRDKPRGERKYDPIWDVQVICAVNKKGELSRKILNELLQRLLNPDGATIEKCPFRIRDKIVNTRNGLLKSADPYADAAVCDQDGKVYVANGEQAEVINVEPGVITAKLTT